MLQTILAAIATAAAAFLARLSAAAANYLMVNGWRIATRFLPVATAALAGLVLYLVGSHLTLSAPARVVLGGSVVLLALASFALGFQVRDEVPAWLLPRDGKPAK